MSWHQSINPSKSARRLLLPGASPQAFLESLLAAELYGDAINVLPHLLSKQGAVWWGCLCAWQAARPEPTPIEAKALQAALRWVMMPSEENRRSAEGPGRAATLQTPAGCLALAAFWSGGSMIAPEVGMVVPPSHATTRLVAGAVMTAAILHEPLNWKQHYCQFLAMGQDIIRGNNLWTELVQDEEHAGEQAECLDPVAVG